MYLYFLNTDKDWYEDDVENIKDAIIKGFTKSSDYVGKLGTDGYRSYIKDYNWGSNKYKSDYGMTFWLLAESALIPDRTDELYEAAEDYILMVKSYSLLMLLLRYCSAIWCRPEENGFPFRVWVPLRFRPLAFFATLTVGLL